MSNTAGGINPVRSGDDVIEFFSLWDIGASGAHTKRSGFPGTGFVSVTETAAGKYTIQFAKNMPVGGLVHLEVVHWPAEDAANMNVRPSKGTFVAETASAGPSVKYESWDNDTTAQTELASGDYVSIRAVFQKSKPTL